MFVKNLWKINLKNNLLLSSVSQFWLLVFSKWWKLEINLFSSTPNISSISKWRDVNKVPSGQSSNDCYRQRVLSWLNVFPFFHINVLFTSSLLQIQFREILEKYWVLTEYLHVICNTDSIHNHHFRDD